MFFPNYQYERSLKISEGEYIIGCDEVGMGPLAGPVVAAACILGLNSNEYRSSKKWYYRIRDSKTVLEAERGVLVNAIKTNCFAFGIGQASVMEIDYLNIHNAGLLAMRRAVENLVTDFFNSNWPVMQILVDGRFKIPGLQENIKQQAIIDGDRKIISISAASLIAKSYRDELMIQMDGNYPGYGFAKHKGYTTKEHAAAIRKLGPSDFHRKSFLKNYS